MVEPLRHRQTKGAATAMFYLMPPRHISTLPFSDLVAPLSDVRSTPTIGRRRAGPTCPKSPTADMDVPLGAMAKTTGQLRRRFSLASPRKSCSERRRARLNPFDADCARSVG